MKTGDQRQFAHQAEQNMVDVFIIVLALVSLVAVVRRRRPVRPITVFLLALITGPWIWANLRDSGWQEEWGGDIPEGLDPVTKAMFYRGWPLAPFMFCIIYFNRFRPGGLEGLVLVFDWLVLIAALTLARFVCERCFRERDRRAQSAYALDRRQDAVLNVQEYAFNERGRGQDYPQMTQS